MLNNAPYPCLWFEQEAADAAAFYCNLFSPARILSQNPLATEFEIKGLRLLALNGRPNLYFTDAFSLVVPCDNQAEIDFYWTHLGVEHGRCGWLKDKYGFSWQIVPAQLGNWMSDPLQAEAVGRALMQMNKIEIAALQQARA